MAYTNPGSLFLEEHGPVLEVEDVLEYCAFLREEAGVGAEPPIDLGLVYARFDIPHPKRAPLPNQQGLLIDPEKGLILINSQDPPIRQRFTEAHELMELLFAALPRSAGRGGGFRAGPFQEPSKERLCNEGAAELLMPRVSFIPRVGVTGASYDAARTLGREYCVSTTAALVHMVRVGPGRHAVVLWRMKNKPTEINRSVPAEQLSLFAEPSSAPAKKLRVEWCLAGTDGVFIARHKSVPEDSSIHQAWREGRFTSSTEFLDLGSSRGKFTCENQPFDLEGERCVLSLMHMPGDR